MAAPRPGQESRQQSRLIPQHLTCKEFGKIYVRAEGPVQHIEFSLWVQELEGAAAEGWQTGVALDASASMKNFFGRNLCGTLPPPVAEDYEQRGWIKSAVHDGSKVYTFKKEAYADAIDRGYLKFTENVVEPLARDFIGYLAGQLDADGGTTVIYWACGDGSQFEVVGDFTEAQCKTLELKGPQKVTFGETTRLVPAVRYFVERFKDAERGIYVVLTDGKIDDLEELKRYTINLAREIEAKKRNQLKCILIGVGDQIDEGQMEELDDLETGTEVDIWDHKIASDLRGVNEIIVELVDDNAIVAPHATIYDATGAVVKEFTDGLPAKAAFSMPASSTYFELQVGEVRIRQTVAAA